MKTIRFFTLIVFFLIHLAFLQAQVVQTDLCIGDEAVLAVSIPVGAWVHWQSSFDGNTFTDITGATHDTLVLSSVQYPMYYRAMFTDLQCDPYPSFVQFINTINPPTPANAGPDITSNSTSFSLNGNTPTVGLGTWTILSGGGGMLVNPNFAQTAFNGQMDSTYVLVWTIAHPPCPPSSDTVTVSIQPSTLPTIICNGQNLYVHPTDNAGPTAWGCIGTVAGAGDDWNGALNTSLIVQVCQPPTAADVCASLNAFGFSDWYLPAYNELDCLRSNASAIGGFSNAAYWSSTEGTGIFTSNARYRTFPSGVSGYGSKSSTHRVRCVRK
jgi:hypothetical protein